MQATRVVRKEAMWALREMGGFGRWMRDQPNLVPEGQKFFQSVAKPTYIKKDSDKFTMLTVFGLFGCGFLMFGAGTSAGRRSARDAFGAPRLSLHLAPPGHVGGIAGGGGSAAGAERAPPFCATRH